MSEASCNILEHLMAYILFEVSFQSWVKDNYPFCKKEEETINHFFITCDLVYNIWSIINY